MVAHRGHRGVRGDRHCGPGEARRVATANPGIPLPDHSLQPAPTQPRVFYKNCAEAHKDGRWNIPADDPAYRPGLDKDNDGIACSSRARRWAV